MYKRPDDKDIYEQLKLELSDMLELPMKKVSSLARLTLDVEFALALMEYLILEKQPITSVWCLLSGTPIYDDVLLSLTDDQIRALANTREILEKYSGSFSWEQALRDYIRHIPYALRLYDYQVNQPLERSLVDGSRISAHRFELREAIYQEQLNTQLDFSTRRRSYAEANKTYQITAPIENGEKLEKVSVKFTPKEVQQTEQHIPYFELPHKPRRELTIRLDYLGITSQYLDGIEENLRQVYQNMRPIGKTWQERLDDIIYQRVDKNGQLRNTDKISIDGFLHLAGMVGSGKSTMALLIAAHFVHRWLEPSAYPDFIPDTVPLRLTYVVGDVASCLELIDKINLWFFDDPEHYQPVAVPLIGKTQRAKHLKQLHNSKGYRDAIEAGRIHWAERFLNPACRLQAKIDISQLQSPIVAGEEPCNRLMLPPTKKQIDNARNKKQKPPTSKSHMCPFYGKCPSKQRWHDMVSAQIWVTTPGGIAQGTLPPQMEKRIVKVGDIVYEQSDLVIFDEADTVMDWFDRVYAQQTKLTAKGDGLLDEIHRKLPPYWEKNRNLSASKSRWVSSSNHVIIPVGHILKQLQQYKELRNWLTSGYFTARSLFYKISRRLLGLKEFEDSINDSQRYENEQRIQPILDVFVPLQHSDPLDRGFPVGYSHDKPVTYEELWKYWQLKESNINSSTGKEAQKIYNNLLEQVTFRLTYIMSSTQNSGDSTQEERVLAQYERWIIDFVPNITERLTSLRQKLEDSPQDQWWQQDYLENSLDAGITPLAKRLELATNAALLDRHIRIIFYEWHNRPDDIIKDAQPFRRVPRSVQNILPRPATGQLFGIYYWSKEDKKAAEDELSSLAYTNIGRQYLLNFHRLRADLEGITGPNVIAMSGTSFLPDSVKWHIGGVLDSQLTPSDEETHYYQLTTQNYPKAVLKPSKKTNKAIAKSEFTFKPLFAKTHRNTLRPIRVSGVRDKRRPLEQLMLALVGVDEAGKHLGNALRKISRLAQNELSSNMPPEERLWQDRERALLLVNSYDQAKLVAEVLRHNWHQKHKKIYHLVRTKDEDASDIEVLHIDTRGKLQRVDIERFAETGGEVLIAPLSAIGRGFNILNTNGKAAFGTIMFLTRPYPHPQDTPAIAQELNRRINDWFADPNFSGWQRDSILKKAETIRKLSNRYWRSVEGRRYYKNLQDDSELKMFPVRDIAATTVGYIIQAVGRLLRGGVPFHAYFLDAAWAPNSAQRINDDSIPHDTAKTSLLVAMIDILADYVADSDVGEALYAPLARALEYTNGLDY